MTRADKGGATMILYRTEYFDKVHALVDGAEVYEIVDSDPKGKLDPITLLTARYSY